MNWKSTGTPTQIEVDNVLITSAGKIAEIMNTFFIEKVSLIRRGMKNLLPDFTSCNRIMEGKNCKLGLSHVSEEKVRKLISSLSNSRSLATDEMDNYAVKVAGPAIAKPLHHIQSLHLGPIFRTLVRFRTFLMKVVRKWSGFASKVRILGRIAYP